MRSRAAWRERSRRTPTSVARRSNPLTKAEKCVQQLFRVARDFDSWCWARLKSSARPRRLEFGARFRCSTGPGCTVLFHSKRQRAFHARSRFRTRTENSREGSVSVGSVAVDLARKIFGQPANVKFWYWGGETSERTAGRSSHGA